VLQQFEIRRRGWIEIDTATRGESIEGFARAVRAEILGHGAENILHRHCGPPAPECRCDRRQRVRHEDISLQPFDRRRRPHQRQHDIGQDIERQAPERAVQQRWQFSAEQVLWPQRLDTERAVLQEQDACGTAFKGSSG
jgi:hypothetical protein